MPGLREPGIAGGAGGASPAALDRGRVECDVGPRNLMIAGYRPPWRRSAGSGWTRFLITRLRYARPPARGRCTGGTFALRLDLSDEPGPSPGIGGLLREIDRGPIAVFWGWPVQAGASAQGRRLTVPLPSRGVPGALFPGVTDSPGISRTAPDHPRKPAAAALPERLWLTCL